MWMIIGMPIRAIVLPTGRGHGAIWEMMSAARASPEPMMIEQGMVLACMDVPRMVLDRCGETMPTKPSGPQKAVTAPVIRQAPSSAMMRVREGSAPTNVAYSSPKRVMSSLLEMVSERVRPTARAAAMIRISAGRLAMKLPADQL